MNQDKQILYMRYDKETDTIFHIYVIVNIDYSFWTLYNTYNNYIQAF